MLVLLKCIYVFFFFQAEDGIRDKLVTGVQTCALPICGRCRRAGRAGGGVVPGAGPRAPTGCRAGGEHSGADRPRAQRAAVGLRRVRLWDVSSVCGGGGAGAHHAQVVSAVPRQDGDAGAASGGRRRPDGARHVPGAAGPAVERGGAQRPDRPVVCRVVRGPGQLQAGERPVRPRGGERGAAADGARVRVAHAPHRPGGALRRGRGRDCGGAHRGGGGPKGGGGGAGGGGRGGGGGGGVPPGAGGGE